MTNTSGGRQKGQQKTAQQISRTPSPPPPQVPTEKLCWRLAKAIARVFRLAVATPARKTMAILAGVAVLASFYEYYVDTVPFPHPKPEELHPLDTFPFMVSNESKFFDLLVDNFECKLDSFINRSSGPIDKGTANYAIMWTGTGSVSAIVKQRKLEISANFASITSQDKNIKIRRRDARPFTCNISQGFGFGNLLLFKVNPDRKLEPDGTPGPRIPIEPVSLNITLTVHYYTMPFHVHRLRRTFVSDPFEIVYKDGQYFWSDLVPAK